MRFQIAESDTVFHDCCLLSSGGSVLYKAYDVKINCAKSIYAISAADAGVYNRIINGSYFAGYAVIAAMGTICGTICLHGGIMCENCD